MGLGVVGIPPDRRAAGGLGPFILLLGRRVVAAVVVRDATHGGGTGLRPHGPGRPVRDDQRLGDLLEPLLPGLGRHLGPLDRVGDAVYRPRPEYPPADLVLGGPTPIRGGHPPLVEDADGVLAEDPDQGLAPAL